MEIDAIGELLLGEVVRLPGGAETVGESHGQEHLWVEAQHMGVSGTA